MFYATLPFKRYFEFAGRSRRKEYWFYVLLLVVGIAIAAVLDRALGLNGTYTRNFVTEEGFNAYFQVSGGVLTGIWGFLNVIPNIAVGIRRLHDTDRSGWWILILLIPIAGLIIWIVFMCRNGTRGPNRFGPDPKASLPA